MLLGLREAVGLRALTAHPKRDFLASVALPSAVFFVLYSSLLSNRIGLGHDAYAYPPRLAEFYRALQEVTWPRWSPNLSNGHGQPIFVFVPPLPYAVGSAFFAVLGDFGLSLNLTQALFLVLGAVSISACARLMGGNPVLAASAFLSSSWVLTDVYVRSAIAELTAMSCYPLVILGLLRGSPLISAFGVALVLTAHFPAALLLVPSTMILGTAWAIQRKSATPLLQATAAVLLGSAWSAFAWFPASNLASLVNLGKAAFGYTDVRLHFLELRQLISGEFGYGLSVEGPDDGMSFSLGLLHFTFAAIGLSAAWRARQQRVWMLGLSAWVVGACLLTTHVAEPIFAGIPVLAKIQFPWRALMIGSLGLPLLIAMIRSQNIKVVGLVVISLVLPRYPEARPSATTQVPTFQLSPAAIATGMRSSINEEYEPVAVERREPPWETDLHRVRRGLGTAVVTRKSANTMEVVVATPSSVTLALSQHTFPDLEFDGNCQNPTLGAESPSGLVTLEIQAPGCSGTIRHGLTSIERITRLLSISSLFGALLVRFFLERRSAKLLAR